MYLIPLLVLIWFSWNGDDEYFLQCWSSALGSGLRVAKQRLDRRDRLTAGPACLLSTWGSGRGCGPPPLGPPHLDPAKGQGFSCLRPVQTRVIKGDTLFNSSVTGSVSFFFYTFLCLWFSYNRFIFGRLLIKWHKEVLKLWPWVGVSPYRAFKATDTNIHLTILHPLSVILWCAYLDLCH